MKVLWCKIFGHKFYYTSYVPNGIWEQGVSGGWFQHGDTYRHYTDHCTRCGIKLSNINEANKLRTTGTVRNAVEDKQP